MQGLGAIAIGVLGLIVIFTIIPIVGESIDNAVTLPSCTYPGVNTTGCEAGYGWNNTATGTSAIPSGISLWTSLGGILKVGAIVIVIAGFLRTLQGMRS